MKTYAYHDSMTPLLIMYPGEMSVDANQNAYTKILVIIGTQGEVQW